jgi:hypothetical protein
MDHVMFKVVSVSKHSEEVSDTPRLEQKFHRQPNLEDSVIPVEPVVGVQEPVKVLYGKNRLMVPRVSKKKRGKSSRGRGKRSAVPRRQREGYPMYSNPRTLVPPEFDTEMKYIVDYLIGVPAANLDSLRYTTNAYDVDPSLGSTAMAGFSEFASLYQRFRTLAIGYKFMLANKETFPVSVIAGFSAVPIAAGSLGMNYAENPLFSTSIMGGLTGQNTKIMSHSLCPLTQIVGTAQPLYDDTYTGSTTSSTLPTVGTCYTYIGISANGLAGGFVAGVIVQVEVRLRIRFYRPNFLTT